MNKLQKLIDIRNNLTNKLINPDGIERLKNAKLFKGGFLKNMFKFIFLKPFSIKNETREDFFATDGKSCNGNNSVKILAFVPFCAVGIVFLLLPLMVSGGKLSSALLCLIFIFTFIECLILFILFCIWGGHNYEIKKEFSRSKLKEIKETAFKMYNKKDLDILIGKTLTKKELNKIMSDICNIIDKKEVMTYFKKMEPLKNKLEITEPYVIINILNNIINDHEAEIENKENKKLLDKNMKVLEEMIKEEKNLELV